MTARRGKSAPIALRWFAALQDATDLPIEYPSATAVIAVSAVLLRYADSDGRNCRPAVDTIVAKARVSTRSVRLALAWLVEAGWLAVVAKHTQHRPTVYRLTFPMGAQEHPYDDAQRVPTSTPWNGSEGAPEGAPEGARRHPDLLPPTKSEEEEESASAPLPDGRVAALVDDRVRFACRTISERAKVTVDPATLAQAFLAALERTDWPATALAVYGIEKLNDNRGRVRYPSAFLAADLGHVQRGLEPSPRVRLAIGLGQLDELDRDHERSEAHYEIAPSAVARDAALRAEVVDGHAFGAEWLWSAKPAAIEKVLPILRDVIRQQRRRIRQQRKDDST